MGARLPDGSPRPVGGLDEWHSLDGAPCTPHRTRLQGADSGAWLWMGKDELVINAVRKVGIQCGPLWKGWGVSMKGMSAAQYLLKTIHTRGPASR